MIQTCPAPALRHAVFSGASPPSPGSARLCQQKYLKLLVALHHNQQWAHNNSKPLPLHPRSTTPPETKSTHSNNQGKRKHIPAPPHSTKDGHFRQPDLAHQYIQCSFCGFAQKLPRTTAHPEANKINKQHTLPHFTINNNPNPQIFEQALARLSGRLLFAGAAA